MSVFDVRDVTHVICRFIQAGDIYNLSKVNKTLKSYSLLFYFVKERLREKKVHIPKGFSISGSFLLNILSKFDNDEVPGDVDLYTNLKHGETITQLFEEQGYNSVKFKQIYFGNCKYIDGVQTFTKENCPKIDIIFISEQVSPHVMIEENFDVTCVKNWYDGKQLYIKDILNTTGIGFGGKVTKLDNYKNSYYTRFLKYLKRGYTIDNNHKPIYNTIYSITQGGNFTYGIVGRNNYIPRYLLNGDVKLFVRLEGNHIVIDT